MIAQRERVGEGELLELVAETAGDAAWLAEVVERGLAIAGSRTGEREVVQVTLVARPLGRPA